MKTQIIRCKGPSKMAVLAFKAPDSLYDKDFYRWILEQKKHLKAFELNALDVENLIEEMDDLGKSLKHALGSHLRNLLMHKLKSVVQPKTRSWDGSIKNAQAEIEDILLDSPILKRTLPESLHRQYPRARELASLETKISLKKFPEQCPWTLEQILK